MSRWIAIVLLAMGTACGTVLYVPEDPSPSDPAKPSIEPSDLPPSPAPERPDDTIGSGQSITTYCPQAVSTARPTPSPTETGSGEGGPMPGGYTYAVVLESADGGLDRSGWPWHAEGMPSKFHGDKKLGSVNAGGESSLTVDFWEGSKPPDSDGSVTWSLNDRHDGTLQASGCGATYRAPPRLSVTEDRVTVSVKTAFGDAALQIVVRDPWAEQGGGGGGAGCGAAPVTITAAARYGAIVAVRFPGAGTWWGDGSNSLTVLVPVGTYGPVDVWTAQQDGARMSRVVVGCIRNDVFLK